MVWPVLFMFVLGSSLGFEMTTRPATNNQQRLTPKKAKFRRKRLPVVARKKLAYRSMMNINLKCIENKKYLLHCFYSFK